LLRAVEPLEHVPPVPGSLLETRGWQAKEALVCGQDTIEVGDCNVTCMRVFITNVKGTFLGMSESEEASKRR
jgi:hypothetical protein